MTNDTQPSPDPEAARMGRLLARPQPAPGTAATGVAPVAPGSLALDLTDADGRESLLYVPADYDATHQPRSCCGCMALAERLVAPSPHYCPWPMRLV